MCQDWGSFGLLPPLKQPSQEDSICRAVHPVVAEAVSKTALPQAIYRPGSWTEQPTESQRICRAVQPVMAEAVSETALPLDTYRPGSWTEQPTESHSCASAILAGAAQAALFPSKDDSADLMLITASGASTELSDSVLAASHDQEDSASVISAPGHLRASKAASGVQDPGGKLLGTIECFSDMSKHLLQKPEAGSHQQATVDEATATAMTQASQAPKVPIILFGVA